MRRGGNQANSAVPVPEKQPICAKEVHQQVNEAYEKNRFFYSLVGDCLISGAIGSLSAFFAENRFVSIFYWSLFSARIVGISWLMILDKPVDVEIIDGLDSVPIDVHLRKSQADSCVYWANGYMYMLTIMHSFTLSFAIFVPWTELLWSDILRSATLIISPFVAHWYTSLFAVAIRRWQEALESHYNLLTDLNQNSSLEDLNPETRKAIQDRQKIKEDVEAKFKPPDDVRYRQLIKLFKPYFWPQNKEINIPLPNISNVDNESHLHSVFVHRLACVSVWIIIIFQRISGVITPLLYAATINSLTIGDYQWAMIWIASQAGFTVLRNVLGNLRGVLFYKFVIFRAYIEIAETAFSKMHELHVGWHLDKKIGNVVRSMDRGIYAAQTLMTFLFTQIIPLVLEFSSVCGVFFFHFQNKTLAAILFFCAFYYSWITVRVALWRRKLRLEANRLDNKFHDSAADSLINFETVKLFCNEKFEVRKFISAVREYQDFDMQTQFVQAGADTTQQFLKSTTLVCCLVISVVSVRSGNLNVGEFVAVNTYINNLFGPLNSIGAAYLSMIRSLVDIHNLTELLDSEPEVVDIPNAKPLLLPMQVKTNRSLSSPRGVSVEFRNVYFHYKTQAPELGLQDISFVVQPGKTCAIVGSTGAGKTSIGRMLIRTYDVNQGAVLINESNIAEVTQQSVRAAVGVVPQDTQLFHDTIRMNIAYGDLDASQEEIEAAAEAAQLTPFISTLTMGWDTVVGERGLKLSGGERQRVAIARCLLKNPVVVLLDEATSALDTVTETMIQQALINLGANRTVLVIAHRLSTVRNADEIIVLEAGKIIERGTHEELLCLGGQYGVLWNAQTEEMLKGELPEGQRLHQKRKITDQDTPIGRRISDEQPTRSATPKEISCEQNSESRA